MKRKHKKPKQFKPKSRFSLHDLVIVIVVFAILGTVFLFRGKAATPSQGFINGIYGSDPNFFPITVWQQQPEYYAQQYKDIGINIFSGLDDGPSEERLSLLKKAGLGVTLSQQKSALNSFPQYSSLYLGWQKYDEPDNAQGNASVPCISSTEVINTYNEFKAADPARPVIINFGQAVANPNALDRGYTCYGQNQGPGEYTYTSYAKGADILSFDVYPANHGYPITYVADGVDNLKKWVGTSKPIWAFIETTQIEADQSKPTPEQVKAEVWLALTHGASGIQYFVHVFTPTYMNTGLLVDGPMSTAVHNINSQISNLAPVLNSPTIDNGASVSATARIDHVVKKSNNQTYLFAVSPNSGNVNATFTVAGQGSGTVAVIDENRTIAMTNGSFTDSFAGYGVHLYQISSTSPGASTVATANPNASANAKAVLNYLSGLPSRPTHRTISGLFLGFSPEIQAGKGMDGANTVYANTGHWLGMAGADYAFGNDNFQSVNDLLTSYWNQGGLVTLSYHSPNPFVSGGYFRDRSGVDIPAMLTPGTTQRQQWLAQMDATAAGLQKLRDNGVVVLWRPFHEMDDDFFWWGARDPTQFQALWRDEFNYFTNNKGLNNLIWVYGGGGNLAYYPGSAYVDVVGKDVYAAESASACWIDDYDSFRSLGKPFALTEYGPEQPGLAGYSWTDLLACVKQKYGDVSYILHWSGDWGLDNPKYINSNAYLDDPWMANREDIAWKSSSPTPTPTDKPNLSISSLTAIPATPKTGDKVNFTAVIMNAVGAPTIPAGTEKDLSFRIDGQEVTWAIDINAALPGGQSLALTTGTGTTNGPWTATTGSHTLEAYVDNLGKIAESNEDDNTKDISLPVSAPLPSVTSCSATEYKAEYFNNASLSGSPVASRCESTVDNDWGSGGPSGVGVGTDNFSVRWTNTKSYTAGSYHVLATADDGVRVWVDNVLVIDKWFDQGATTYSSDQNLTAGNHTIKMEYYEHGYQAAAKLAVTAVVSANPPPIPSPPAPKVGDLNSDGKVNIFDLGIFLNHYGTHTSSGDLNHDNVVNIFDLGIFLSKYGQ